MYDGYRNRLFQWEELDGIHILRLWTYVTANEGVVKRTLNYVSYMVSAVLAVRFLRRVDVVISTSPQFFNGLAGYVVSRLKSAPWVLEIRDLWPESIIAVGAIRNPSVIKWLERMEMFAYRHADCIVPVTDAFRRYMLDRGVPDHKIHVIKNGVDLRFYQQPAEADAEVEGLQLQGKFVASYFGTIGMAHHLETILDAARELEDQKDIVFLVVGDGAEREKLVAMRDEMGLSNVQIVGQQPKRRMPALWALSGASLVLLKKSDLFKTVIPSKIFESMAMRKPVILGVEGESKGIIEAAGAGICIAPEDSAALARAVLKLCREPELRSRLGENGHRHATEHFDRAVLAQRFAALLEALPGMRKATGIERAR